ncbi:MAG TPA: MFS transporter [Woeseiaceae bacterium]|nr:MFS transporter [Woeseiaceae bacterium]
MTKVVYSSDPEVQKSLRHSLKDAAAFATMVGVGETYFSAFAIFLKASTPQIGLLASLPPLLASLVQLFSAWLGRVTGHRKRLILIGASVQAFAWIPIIFLPILFSEHAVPLFIACVVLYHCGAHLTTPQWGSMMGDIVPLKRRGRFFAVRTRVVSLVTFIGLTCGGLVLQFASSNGRTLEGFLGLFIIALLARAVSVYHLTRMHDPSGHVQIADLAKDQRWWSRLRQSNFARFSIFFALMQFSVSIASPFFTVFMLRDLHYSYMQFMANTGMAIFAQFLTLNQWGRISDIFGNRRILSATGLVIPLMPLLWVFSQNFWYLLFAQAFSGFVWAGFTLSASNFLYDLIARDKRATYLATHNVLASVGIFAGAITGGYLGTVLPSSLTFGGHTVSWLSPLLGVFAISAVARATIVALLVPKLREVRNVRPISFTNLIFRVTRVNALAGMIFEVVGPKPDKLDDVRDDSL